MRLFAPVLALTLAFAVPAIAQDNTAPSASAQIAHASHTLAAIWRPITTTTQSALVAACAGASDDLTALNAALPSELSNRTVAAVHVGHGLVFVPTSESPAEVYVFPDTSLSWWASGVSLITAANEDTGEITLRDAAGVIIHLQLGHVASQVLMRLTTPGGQNITFAGCSSTIDPAPDQGGDAPG